MAYIRPPLVANASGAIPGAGTATVAAVAAPGVGFAIRLVGGQMSINRAVTNGDVELRDGTPNSGVARAFGMNNAGTATVPFTIPEPGYQLTENSALNLLCTSTAGAGTFSCTVYYYIDPV